MVAKISRPGWPCNSVSATTAISMPAARMCSAKAPRFFWATDIAHRRPRSCKGRSARCNSARSRFCSNRNATSDPEAMSDSTARGVTSIIVRRPSWSRRRRTIVRFNVRPQSFCKLFWRTPFRRMVCNGFEKYCEWLNRQTFSQQTL